MYRVSSFSIRCHDATVKTSLWIKIHSLSIFPTEFFEFRIMVLITERGQSSSSWIIIHFIFDRLLSNLSLELITFPLFIASIYLTPLPSISRRCDIVLKEKRKMQLFVPRDLFPSRIYPLSFSLFWNRWNHFGKFFGNDGRYFAAASCERWRGSHATVGQVGAFSFSSMELRGFAVSAGIGRGW